MKMDQ